MPALISNGVPAANGTAGPLGAGKAGTDDHPELRGKHVLVIDDDARNVFAITSTLELHDVVVTRASDGRQGIEVLRADPETDLILMDVMMPGMDGYATMTAIRQMPEFGSLPIIAVTARAMPSDREKSLAAGANDYVTKPVDTDELIACMERLAGRTAEDPRHATVSACYAREPWPDGIRASGLFGARSGRPIRAAPPGGRPPPGQRQRGDDGTRDICRKSDGVTGR